MGKIGSHLYKCPSYSRVFHSCSQGRILEFAEWDRLSALVIRRRRRRLPAAFRGPAAAAAAAGGGAVAARSRRLRRLRRLPSYRTEKSCWAAGTRTRTAEYGGPASGWKFGLDPNPKSTLCFRTLKYSLLTLTLIVLTC